MSNCDEILDGERPSVASGFLVQSANRRQVEFALKSLNRDQIAEVVRDHLVNRFGANLAARIIDEMVEGLVFKKTLNEEETMKTLTATAALDRAKGE